MAAAPGGQEGRTRWWVPHLAVGSVAAAVYVNSLSNGFTYDDVIIILENPAVHNLAEQARIWLTPYWPAPEAMTRGLYRPLTIFLFALQWSLGGGSPFIFHLVNVGLHAGASALVYRLVSGLVGWRGGFVGATIFAVHPVHVEAVANGVGQAELVSACFLLVAAVIYAERPWQGGLTLKARVTLPSLFLLGMLAKEHAVVLPLLLLALDVAQRRWKEPGFLSRTLELGLVLGAVAAFYLSLRWVVLGGGLTGEPALELWFLLDPFTRILNALSVWPEYLRLLFFPVDLSATYDPDTLPIVQTLIPRVWAGGLLFLLALGGALLPRGWPGLGLGCAWFLASILPVSNLLFPVGTVLAERLLYLPSVAVAIWMGYGVRWVSQFPRQSWAMPALGTGLVILFIGLSLRVIDRNPVWAGNEALVRQTLEDHPENFRAHWMQAIQLARHGDSAASLVHWDRATAIYGENAALLTAYAAFLRSFGATAEAEDLTRRALEIRPRAVNALFLQALIEIDLHRPDQARTRIRTLESLGFSRLADQLTDSLVAQGVDEAQRPVP